MTVLDFGLKKNIKNVVLVVLGFIIMLFIIDLIKANSLNELLDDIIYFRGKKIRYTIPIIMFIPIVFFTKLLFRIEICDDTLMISSFRFFRIRVRKIKINEGLTYTVKQKEELFSSPKRLVIISIKGKKEYTIKEPDLNHEEMDQVIEFLSLHIPEKFKMIDE